MFAGVTTVSGLVSKIDLTMEERIRMVSYITKEEDRLNPNLFKTRCEGKPIVMRCYGTLPFSNQDVLKFLK